MGTLPVAASHHAHLRSSGFPDSKFLHGGAALPLKLNNLLHRA